MGQRAVALILDAEWVLQQREVGILENGGSGRRVERDGVGVPNTGTPVS